MSKRIISHFICLALAGGMLSSIQVDYADAARRTLLEQIFPKLAERKRQRQLELERQNAEPVKRIKGPTYYNYKLEGMKTIGLASLLVDPPLPSKIDREPFYPPTSQSTELLGAVGTSAEKPDFLTTYISPTVTASIKVEPPKINREALDGWSMKVEAGIAEALEAHYVANPNYLWVDENFQPTQAALDVMATLARSDEFGLDNAHYSTPNYSANNQIDSVELRQEQIAAKFELGLTASALRYASDAETGIIDPNKISGYHDIPGYQRNYSQNMSKLAEASNPSQMLESMHPDNTRFASLVAELAELRTQSDTNTLEPIAGNTFFKPGQSHEELPNVIAAIAFKGSAELKQTHSQVINNYLKTELYDEPLVELVRDFQKENQLTPDGIVGSNTLSKLQVTTPKSKIKKVKLAMERLRWLPEDLGNRHVFINQPAYRANYVVNNNAKLSMRAIVGKPSNQTSFFHDIIETVEVNPYWNVPRSILVNEMLGNLRSDPSYLPARNYEVVAHGGRQLDPYSVDWFDPASTKKYYIRQRPGGGNALGELKILFPNKHSIYMHDTPSRGLFKRSKRALSHGCIRLHKPRDMAAAVLQTSVEQIGSYIAGGKNRGIPVKNQIPVYVSYFTAWPEDNGTVRFYTDIYGRDKALQKALAKTEQSRVNAISNAS